jgi:hypothetical protein
MACGNDGDGSSQGAAAAARAETPSVASAPLSLAVDPGLLPSGTVQAWLEGEALVSALASESSRGAILEVLAREARFELVIGTPTGLEQRVSLRALREPVEVVVTRVLTGVPHAMDYPADPTSGTTHLRVTVGASSSVPLASGAPASHVRERRRELTEVEQQERAERAQRLWAQSLENLESSDPELRADGARWLDVNSSEGFEAAVEHLENDESPAVRAAAAEVLIDSDVGAVQPLLQALDDPDPRVVLAALEALEFVGDASTIPHLAPLVEHKDAVVRERTVEAIEFLQ